MQFSKTFDSQLCFCIVFGDFEILDFGWDVLHRFTEVIGEVFLMEAVGIHEVVDELIRAIGDAVAKDGGKALQQADVVILVEEGGLDEDGGHGRAAQDGELGA